MADTPESSDYTSVQRRINDLKSTSADEVPARDLFPFVGNPREEMPKGLPFVMTDYLELVDWTGRIVREDKRGSICTDTPSILQRLKIEPDAWLQLTTRFEDDFCNLVGRPDSLPGACAALGLSWARGTSHCRKMFSS